MKRIVLFLVMIALAGSLLAEPEPAPPIVNIPPLTAKNRTAKIVALKSPRPEYPAEAGKRHWSGVGWFAMHLDEPTGVVTSVVMLQSTGHKILDRACIDALRKWRFIPHAGVKVVKTPITFTAASDGRTESEPHQKTSMLDSPLPTFPFEARSRRMTGCGKFQIEFEPKSGKALKVFVVASTGAHVCDASAVDAFMRWRTHPGTLEHVIVPVCFDFSSGGPTVHY